MNKYLWNTAAGLLNAAEAIILGMITTRVAGVEAAGILTLAFSLANIFVNVGKWGTRNVQVTSGSDISFYDYKRSKLITIPLMIVLFTIYIALSGNTNGYIIQKSLALFFMCLIYAFESYEDVYWGFYQKCGHIETGAQIFIIRWITIIAIYWIVLLLTKDVAKAIGIAMVVSAVVLFLMLQYSYQGFQENAGNKEHKEIEVLKQCFPIMILNVIQFYSINAPKLALDTLTDDRTIAIYGFISMPVFIVSLFSSFIYTPMLTNMSDEYQSGDFKSYNLRIKKIMGITVLFTVACAALAYFLGTQVLGLLYAVDLSLYKIDLTILVISGGFYGIANFIATILTIEAKQKNLLIISLVIAGMSLLLYNPVIKFYGIDGATYIFMIIMIAYAFISCIFAYFGQRGRNM